MCQMLVGMFLVFSCLATFLLPIVGQQALIGLRDRAVRVAQSAILALVTMAAAVLEPYGATRVLNRQDILSA
jgi:hypothetical protein